jgi:phosphoenolpyruvate synthase/pyruvate phosphate dikinase
MYTVSLEDANHPPAQVGSKAHALGSLSQAGVLVPPGFVVTTEAHRAYLRHNRVGELNPEAAEKIRQGQFPSAISTAIFQAFDALSADARVAVRSSNTLEDLASASFAGQYETVLDVRRDSLLQAIVTCWQSQCDPRLTAYLHRQGLRLEDCAMAVIVQKMVDADVAGVCFSIHPLTGADELVINANWGLGESVVAGLATPDTIVVAKAHRAIVARHLGDKEHMVRPKATGGVETTETPVALRRRLCLTPNQVEQLTHATLAIEHRFRQPVDVEFAFEQDNLYILQARAITGQQKGSIMP